MIALALYLASLIGTSPATSKNPRCEDVGPRLDRTYVTICDGSMVSVRDHLGNVRLWNRRHDTVQVAVGGNTMVLGR